MSSIGQPAKTPSELYDLAAGEKPKGAFDSLDSLKQFGEDIHKAAIEAALEETAQEILHQEETMEKKKKAYAGMIATGNLAKDLQKKENKTAQEKERQSALLKSEQSQKRAAMAQIGSKPQNQSSLMAQIAARKGQTGTPEQPTPPDQPAPPIAPEQQQTSAEQLRKQQQQKRLEQIKKQLLSEGGGMLEKEKAKVQEEIRKQVKVAIRRGAEESAQAIGGAVDCGTGGISLIVTILVYFFTLIDLNVQMISYYQKNQALNLFFPPLTWSPIPMPHIVSVKFLHIGLVVADLLVVIMAVVGLMSFTVMLFLPLILVVGGVGLISEIILNESFRSLILNIFI